MTRRTLNYGLRYDLNLPAAESQSRFSEVDPTVPNPGAGNIPGAYIYFGSGSGRNRQKRPHDKGKWNAGWTKSGAILTDKIDGKYWMYYLGDARDRNTQMGIAYSEDLLHWTDALDHPVLASRPGSFDATVVEPGPAPILTPDGILLIYNGADEKQVYQTGWVLFDKRDPTKVLARAEQPTFRPEKEGEKVGQVPNVVLVEGLVREEKRWLFYYGGADKNVEVAAAPIR